MCDAKGGGSDRIIAVINEGRTVMNAKTLDEIMETLARLMPQTPQDMQKNLRAALGGLFERLDLVTREELDVQESVLRRTREQLERMEKRVIELETRIK